MVGFSEQPPPPGASLLPPVSYSANSNAPFSFQHMSSANTEHTRYPIFSDNLFPVNPLSPSVRNLYPHFQTISQHVSVLEPPPFVHGVATQHSYFFPNNFQTQPINSRSTDMKQTGNGMANSLGQPAGTEAVTSDASSTFPVNVIKPCISSTMAPHDILNSTCPCENTIKLLPMAQVAADEGVIEQKGDSDGNDISKHFSIT